MGKDIENLLSEATLDDPQDDFDSARVLEAASGEVKDSPEEVFWGTLISKDDQTSSPMLYRLVISIFDHVAATAKAGSPAVASKEAKPYLNSYMIEKFLELMDIDDLKSFFKAWDTPENTKSGLKSEMYFGYLEFLHFKPEKHKGAGKFPVSLVSRENLRNWLVEQAIANPDLTHRRINNLLATKEHVFLDPLTDAVWQYPQIPRSAFPETANEEVAKKVQHGQIVWEKFQTFVRTEFKPKGRTWTESSAQQYWQNHHASSIALANAELNAARMRSQAIRNAHVERRIDPRTHISYNYTPGNF